jgi:DNA repair photolyase
VFPIYQSEAQSVLSPTSGFIAQAGFTHSLTPARNCTFGCSYCYVPTMRIYGGLKPDDWKKWGQFTTYKSNAPELVAKGLRKEQVIYCSPLVDPYQPPEKKVGMMTRILEAMLARPPAVLVIQTRGPLVVRDVELLKELRARVSFSVTTDQEKIRRIYEPRCASIAERWETISRLRSAGIETFATLAPILPCDPERLISLALEATDRPVIVDPFHVRATKARGATTRPGATRISEKYGLGVWHEPDFQAEIVARMAAIAGRRFGAGVNGFKLLASY